MLTGSCYEVPVIVSIFKERKAVVANLKKKQKAEMGENTAENTKSSAKIKLKKDVSSNELDYIDDER